MPTSGRFRQLDNRLAELRRHLLPLRFSPIGQYSDRDHDLARAYLVLVHAEIEAYCEDRGRKVARRAHELWQRKGRRTATLMKILKFHHVTQRKPWALLDRSSNKIEAAVNSYMTSIDQNHGIREENLCKILFPIGIEPSTLDSVWVTTMDSFGQFRGTVAHTSVKTQQLVDPQTEFLRVTTQILPGLKKLDRKINRL